MPLERTVLFGFSQGGAMALSCGCSLPLAGVISCSGYPHLAMHGSEDEIVPPTALDSIKTRLNQDRCQSVLFKNGHTIPLEMMQPLQTTLQNMLKSP
ncbi:hypothetical protein OAL11_00665 [bacterium]|nr:hypothetical protein [bacterium]